MPDSIPHSKVWVPAPWAEAVQKVREVGARGPDVPGTPSHSSGDGDLAMIVEVAAGTVDVSITLIYETVGP